MKREDYTFQEWARWFVDNEHNTPVHNTFPGLYLTEQCLLYEIDHHVIHHYLLERGWECRRLDWLHTAIYTHPDMDINVQGYKYKMEIGLSTMKFMSREYGRDMARAVESIAWAYHSTVTKIFEKLCALRETLPREPEFDIKKDL